MKGLCVQVSSSGFWQGIWDGVTAPLTLVASIFFDVQFLDFCARSWWYNCMFLVGVLLSAVLGIFNPVLALIVFVVCLIVFIIWLIFANILYILGTVVGLGLIWWVYSRYLNPLRPRRQNDGSIVYPPPSSKKS